MWEKFQLSDILTCYPSRSLLFQQVPVEFRTVEQRNKVDVRAQCRPCKHHDIREGQLKR